MVFDSVAYKNVVSNGLVLDKTGKKMSKRLGNTIDPFKALEDHGPDAIRWYMISNANPWDNLKFDMAGVEEVRRKFFGTLYNTYSFFALYANIDGFDYSEKEVDIEKRPEIDRWVLSELNSLIAKVDDSFNNYESTKAARDIQNFVGEHLSNWFVRLSRRRFWKGEYQEDKISAYQTLFTCMLTISKLSAPIAPFFMERLYLDLIENTKVEGKESVHLEDFPVSDASLIDESLERKMNKAQQISSMVLSLRKKESLRVRQPLQRIMIPVSDQQDRDDIMAVAELIKSEVNIKAIELIDDASDILVKSIKPNFKVLGPKFGKNMRFVSQAVAKFNKDDIAFLEKNKSINIEIDKKQVSLTLDEFEISSQDIEGWLVANNNSLTIALDIQINEELKNEGIAREFVNRIQNLRKNSGLEVTDKININIENNTVIENALLKNIDYIKTETLSDNLLFDNNMDINDSTLVEFDDIKTHLQIHKII